VRLEAADLALAERAEPSGLAGEPPACSPGFDVAESKHLVVEIAELVGLEAIFVPFVSQDLQERLHASASAHHPPPGEEARDDHAVGAERVHDDFLVSACVGFEEAPYGLYVLIGHGRRSMQKPPPARETTARRFVPALGYDWLTALYDPVVRLTTREGHFKHRLLDQADVQGGMDVLDLGCGTGTLAILAKREAPEASVTGLDADPKVLERALRKAERAGCAVEFDQGLSDELPYPDGSFDRILSSLFFHHLERDAKERTIGEASRVLRGGGELHVADWGRPAGLAMHALSWSIRLLDGAAPTRDNLAGALPDLFEQNGLEKALLRDQMSTIYGTLAFYSASKP
jgi:ubiquinone/menaquinone biosynthesis C-methylase UbiE